MEPRLSRETRDLLAVIANGAVGHVLIVGNGRIPAGALRAAAAEVLGATPGTSPVDELRRRYPRAYEPWDAQEEARLAMFVERRASVSAIAQALERQPLAVRIRIKRLGLGVTDDPGQFATEAPAPAAAVRTRGKGSDRP